MQNRKAKKRTQGLIFRSNGIVASRTTLPLLLIECWQRGLTRALRQEACVLQRSEPRTYFHGQLTGLLYSGR